MNVKKRKPKYALKVIKGGYAPADTYSADGLRKQADTLKMIPDIIRRLDEQLPRKGGAPEAPPLPVVPLVWERRAGSNGWRYLAVASVLCHFLFTCHFVCALGVVSRFSSAWASGAGKVSRRLPLKST